MLRERACRAQGNVVSIAVPGHEVRLQPQPRQQVKHAEIGGADGGLGHLRPRQRLSQRMLFFRRECRGRGDVAAERPFQLARQAALCPVEGLADLGEGHGELAKHVGILRPLAGEEERDLAVIVRRVFGVVDAARVVKPRRGRWHRVQGDAELVFEIFHRCGDDGQGRLRGFRPIGFPQRQGQIGKEGASALHQRLMTLLQRRPEGLGGWPTPDQKLRRPVSQCRRLLGGELVRVLFQREVKVGAAESEGAHPRATRLVAPVNPRPGFTVQVEGAVVEIALGIRLVDERGRQHLAVQGQRCLDEARDAGSTLAVADHRLDRADGARLRLRPGFAEHLAQRLRLRLIADDGAGAVSLDEPDARRGEAGLGVGATKSAELALRARRRESFVATVAGGAHAADHCVDPVAVALGVGQTLQDDRGHSFAQHDAVGGGVERLALPARGQRVRLAEGDVGVRGLHDVGAHGHRHVASSCLQLANTRLHGGQGRPAGRVDRVVGAAEVEAVGHPPHRHIGENAGEGILRPRRQHLLDLLQDLLAGDAQSVHRVEQGQARAESVGHGHGVPAAADAENGAGALSVEGAVGIAGVGQGVPHGFQQVQLQRLDRM